MITKKKKKKKTLDTDRFETIEFPLVALRIRTVEVAVSTNVVSVSFPINSGRLVACGK